VGETLGNLGSRVMIASPCRRSGWSAWPAESPAGWAVPPAYASFFTLDKCGERAQTLSRSESRLGFKMEIPGKLNGQTSPSGQSDNAEAAPSIGGSSSRPHRCSLSQGDAL
jgi:hypothetical protein